MKQRQTISEKMMMFRANAKYCSGRLINEAGDQGASLQKWNLRCMKLKNWQEKHLHWRTSWQNNALNTLQ